MFVSKTGYDYTGSYGYRYTGSQKKEHRSYVQLFRGMSLKSEYATAFDYMSARLVKDNRKFGVNGAMLSARNIAAAIRELFLSKKVYGGYVLSNPDKIKWQNYIPQEIREYCADKVSHARRGRFREWQNFLENPGAHPEAEKYPELINDIKSSDTIRFVIWNAVCDDIKETNRHIPVPFNINALNTTVKVFKDVYHNEELLLDYNVKRFADIYTNYLRNDILNQNGFADKNSGWIMIPSTKREPLNKDNSISALEILSCKNWCTRSSLDKAEAALDDGNFYIYLTKEASDNIWHPNIAMTMYRGEIDQIQGRNNNNFIPLTELNNIKNFLKTHDLKCRSGITDEGPKALQQIMIAEKLAQNNEKAGKSLSRAIKEKDTPAIFKILNYEITYTPDGKYKIGSYRSKYNLDKNSGIVVPYSFMGIDEDVLLSNVETIDGNLNLCDKNPLFNSRVTVFPPNLKRVTGRIVCSREQYDKFGDDIKRVIDDENKIFCHSDK